MKESGAEVIAGGVVLAAAVGFLIFATQAAGVSVGGADGIELSASFRSAEGVTVGTDVKLAGVKIGTVTEMRLNTDTYRADTLMSFSGDVLIPDDSAAVVQQEGLLGGTFVEIVPGGSFDYFADGAEIVDTQGAVGLISLLMAFVGEGEE